MEKTLVSGLLHVTGESDAGKTSFALECGVPPERIAFIDSDVKGRATVQQLKEAGVEFGLYNDFVGGTKGMREVEVYAYGRKIIDTIRPGQYEALVWDTWTEFENTFKPIVSKDPRKYREYYSPMGTIKAGEEWQASFDLETEVINDILAKVPLFVIVTHLKSYNISGKRVEGKFIPACKSPVVTKSLFRLWLRRNPASPVPIALVLKRLNKKVVEGGRIRTVNVLPLKLVPAAGDVSLWDTIERYWQTPFGNQKASGELTPNEYELSILEGTLTEDQKMALRLAVLEAEEEKALASAIVVESETSPFIGEDETKLVREAMNGGGVSAKEIAEQTGVKLPRVLKIMKELQA
jgi:hypothetical protein